MRFCGQFSASKAYKYESTWHEAFSMTSLTTNMCSLIPIPNEPLLRELYAQWQIQPDLVIVRDSRSSKNFSVDALLKDVVQTRDEILAGLEESVKFELQSSSQDVFIAVLAAPDYRFVVLFLAIYSLGAAIVPLSPMVLPEEAKYFLKLCNASLVVASQEYAARAEEITSTTSVRSIVLSDVPANEFPKNSQISLSNSVPTELDKAGSLLYTSGTTGRPKGVLHTRRAIYEHGKATGQTMGFSSKDLYLLFGPMHWIGGFGMLPFCLANSMPMEMASSVFSPSWFWKRIQSDNVTAAILSSWVLAQLEAHFRKEYNTWTPNEQKAVKAGIRRFRFLTAGSTPVMNLSKTFWAELRGGIPLGIGYGATEGLLAITETWPEFQTGTIPSGCVGKPVSGVNIKLSDEGEILIKSKGLFSRYITEGSDPDLEAFDGEGYWRSGDVGRFENGNLYVLGRASTDVIRTRGLRVYGPEIEQTLVLLDSITLASVVGVSDDDIGHHVAALIATSGDANVDLEVIRTKLRTEYGFPLYKLPTLLRVLKQGEEIPRTKNGKVQKRALVERFFSREQIAETNVEVWNLKATMNGDERRAFDWDGL